MRTENVNFGDILTWCYPQLRQWTCTDGTYEGLIWPAARVGATKPSKADLLASWAAYVPPPIPPTPEERIAALENELAAIKAKTGA